MKKSTFKVGQQVWYMESNKPKQAEVKAVLTVQGEVKLDYSTHKSEGEEMITLYSVGYGTILKEGLVFIDAESLKESLFSLAEEK